MKRFISIALVAMLFAISLPLGAFAVTTDAPVIISQPTFADPAFVVSPDDEVTYQWYTLSGDIITDGDATPMTEELLVEINGSPVPDFIRILKDEASFNPENGEWSPMIYGEVGDAVMMAESEQTEFQCYVIIPFVITVEAGDEYFVAIEGVEAPEFFGMEVNNYENIPSEQIGDDTYIITFEVAGTYVFFVATETAPVDHSIVVAKNLGIDEPINGETSATLSCDMEAGVYYYCVATYPDETELVSDLVSKPYYVTKQPTVAEPSVQVSFSDEVESYQWYTFEMGESVAVTDKNASVYGIVDLMVDLIGSVPPGFTIPSIKAQSSYDSENDLWIPSAFNSNLGETTVEQLILIHFAIELAEGDSITFAAEDLSVFAEFELGNLLSEELLEFVENADGSRTYVANSAGQYVAMAMVEFETAVEESSINPEDYAISAYGNVNTPVAIEGKTKAKLSNMTYGEKYFCEITYEDGTVITSKTFKVSGEITKQPTATSPTVGVTFPEAVVSYEWYSVVASDYGSVTPFMVGSYTTENTEEIFGTLSDAIIYNDASFYDPETEIWTPVNYAYEDSSYDYAEFFVIYMEEGESLDLEFVNDVDEGIITDIYLYSDNSGYDAVENDDGTYTITVDEAGEYVLCYNVYYDVIPEGFGAKVYKNNVVDGQLIEGQTGKTLTEKVAGETYMCVVTYEDGAVLTTDRFTVGEDEMWTLGDVNDDGKVDKKDFALVKRYCIRITDFDDVQLLAADINEDGDVDKKDYALLKRICIGA